MQYCLTWLSIATCLYCLCLLWKTRVLVTFSQWLTVSTAQCVAGTLTSKVENLATERSSKLKTQLSNTDVSVTVDICSNRKMIPWCHCATVKYGDRIQLKSNLFSCDRFKGPHTAEIICKQMRPYVTSTALKMLPTISTVCFPIEQEDELHDEDHLDDPELWNDLTLEDQQTVDSAIAKKLRLQCFAHSPAGGGRWLERNKRDDSFSSKMCLRLNSGKEASLLLSTQHSKRC